MISAYSKGNNYEVNVPMDSIDTMGKVASNMQENYNKNREEIDSMLAKYNVNLIRDKDKAALGEKLTALTNLANQSGGLKFTDSGLKSRLTQHFNQAMDADTVAQVDNTRRYLKTMTEIEAKKASGKGYNEANLYYMNKEAGVEDYLSGKTDTLGQMNYSDYFDYNKVLNDNIDKYAKGAGLTSFVSTENQGVYYKDVYGKTVDPDKIKTLVAKEIENDPKIKQQLIINTTYKYKDVSDADFKEGYKNRLNGNITEYTKQAEEITAKRLNHLDDSEEAIQLDNAKNIVNSNINTLKNMRDSEFDRDAVAYNFEVENLKKSFANLYGKKEVTRISRDDIDSRIQSRQITDRLNLAKLEKLNAEANATSSEVIARSKDVDVNSLDDRSNWVIANESKDLAVEALVAKMKTTDLGRNKTDDEIKELIIQLHQNGNEKDFGSKSIPSELRDEINSVGYKIEGLKEVNTKVYQGFEEGFSNQYNTFLASKDKFKLDNLASTMPETVKSIKEGSNFNDLNPTQRAKVLYEFGVSYAIDAGEGSLEKIGGVELPVNIFIDQLKSQNKNVDFSTSRGLDKAGNTFVGQQAIGFGKGVAGTAKALWDVASGLRNMTFGYKTDANKDFASAAMNYNKGRENASSNMNEAGEIMSSWVNRDYSPINLDSDQTNFKGNIGARADYINLSNAISESLKSSVDALVPNVKKEYSAMVNPSLGKGTKKLFNEITTFAPTGLSIPADHSLELNKLDNGDIQVSAYAGTKRMTGTGVAPGMFSNITSYVIKKDDLAQVPSINQIFKTSEEKDYYSGTKGDENINSKKVTYKIPENIEEQSTILNNLYGRGSSFFTEGVLQEMMSSPSSAFKTKDQYRALYPNNAKLEEVLNTKYKVIPVKNGKDLYYSVLKDTAPGRKGEQVGSGRITEMSIFSEDAFELLIPTYIDRTINQILLK